MVLFENCVWRPRLPTKIAAVTKNRKFGKKSHNNFPLWNCWANWSQTTVEWGPNWPPVVSEEILFKLFSAKFSIFSNDGYLGWRPRSSDTFSQRGLSEDHSTVVWDQLAQQFQRGKLLCDFCGHLSKLCPTTPTANQDVRHW
jgi:hypothetical protein